MVILDVLQKMEKWSIFLTTINYNGTKEFNNCTSFSEEEKEQISLTNMYQNKIKNRREKEEKLLDNMQFRFWRTVEAVVPAKTRRRLRSRKKCESMVDTTCIIYNIQTLYPESSFQDFHGKVTYKTSK